ncbi:MAG: hypothetical protein ABIS20_11845 [Thermoanaerobaculia bacterium]
MLERRIDLLFLPEVKVGVAVAALSDKANLPLSFIPADPVETVSLDLHDVTVRQALDALVKRTPRYRYDIIAGRLVLYPRDPKWEMQVRDVHLGPAPRRRMTSLLAKELGRQLPGFDKFAGTWVLGDPRDYIYQDVVTVTGSGSVLEILLQLLGKRPSAYLILDRIERALATTISVSSAEQLQSLKLTAPTTTLRQRDQAVQLKLIGVLRYGGVGRDLTANDCRTAYKVSDERVLTVSPDGLVTACGNGVSRVSAEIDGSVAEITIRVDFPETSGNPSRQREHE